MKKLVFVSSVKQYRKRRGCLCNVRIAFPFVRRRITLRERRIGGGVPNVFAVGVIQKRNVVYVVCIANENIFQIGNGYVLRRTRLMGNAYRVCLYLGVQMDLEHAECVQKPKHYQSIQCGK